MRLLDNLSNEDSAAQETEAYNHCTQGYVHVQSTGLPPDEGRYFIVLFDDPGIYLANLLIKPSGKRVWTAYKLSQPLNDLKIRLWKKIQI